MPKLDISWLREARWFGAQRASGYAKVLLAAYVPGLVICYHNMIGHIGSDYLSFWSAARIAMHGNPAAAYDNGAQAVFQEALGRPFFYPFLYPPPFLALVIPFALLPYGASMLLWASSTFAIYLATARNIMREAFWPIAAFSACYVNFSAAQNGFVTASLFIGGVLALERRPFVAGFLFGALVIKPQLALLIPVALVAARQWRAIAGAALASGGLLLASLALFGEPTMLAYLHTALSSGTLLNGTHPHVKLVVSLASKTPSLFAYARLLGAAPPLALGIQAVLTCALAVLVWRVWASSADMLAKGAVLASAAVLATPYLIDYDMVLLVLPVCWLAREGLRRGFYPWEKLLLALVYAAPLIGQETNAWLGMNVALFGSLLLLWMVVRRWRGVQRDERRPEPVMGASATPA